MVAAKMRTIMAEFNKNLPAFEAVMESRGQDNDQIDVFAATTLASWNEIAAPLANGKWLAETDEPTLADIHVAPYFEMLVAW